MDSQARKTIVTNTDINLFVEAGAGSGKTYSLVRRIVSLILSGKAKIQGIVAITFTNEGAAKLKSEIREILEKYLAGTDTSLEQDFPDALFPEGRENAEKALSDYLLAQISTIHSFCLTLLQQKPIEAGIDPGATINPETSGKRAFNKYWEIYLKEKYPGSSLEEYVNASVIKLDEIKEFFFVASERPHLEIETAEEITSDVVPQEPNSKEINKQIEELLACRKLFEEDLGTDAGKERFKVYNEFGQKLKDLSLAGTPAKAWCNYPVYKPKIVSKIKLFGESHNNYISLISAIGNYYGNALHKKLTEEAKDFIAGLTAYKKQHTLFSFDDLLYFAYMLLKESAEARNFFKRKYTHYFIDEVQDTDPLQTDIIFYLCEKDGENTEQSKEVNLKQGKLFMVGDPKQSIYRFRNADIRMYSQAKDKIQQSGGEVLQLTKNFRSRKYLLDFVNDNLSKEFSEDTKGVQSGFQVNFTELTADKIDEKRFPGKKILIYKHSKNGKIEEEAGAICAKIKQMVNNEECTIEENKVSRRLSYKDFYILFRSGKRVQMWQKKLSENGIPYLESDSKLFFNDAGIMSLLLSVKAIADISDTVSLYGALKSPIFGLHDDDIMGYISDGGYLSLTANTEGKTGQVARCLNFLTGLYRESNALSCSEIITKILDFTGVLTAVYQEQNGEQKAGKYFSFIELVHNIETDSTLSFNAVVDTLSGLSGEDKPPIASLSTAADPDAVKIMTIHKAKGLEAPVVILADAVTGYDHTNKEKYFINSAGKLIIPVLKRYGFGSFTPASIGDEREVAKNSEFIRLRYVAATRAMDYLILALPEEKSKKFYASFREFADTNEGSFEVIAADDSDATSENNREKEAQIKLVYSPVNFPQVELVTEKRFVSVHDKMNVDEEMYRRETGGLRGKEYGTGLHTALQKYILNKSLSQEDLEGCMQEQNLTDNQKELMIEEFESQKSNKYILEAIASEEKYCEWSYYFNAGTEIINGVIDLLYKNADGTWNIVDFKTDDISDAAFRRRAEEVYNRQVQFYKEHFSAITGNAVKEAVILFTAERN